MRLLFDTNTLSLHSNTKDISPVSPKLIINVRYVFALVKFEEMADESGTQAICTPGFVNIARIKKISPINRIDPKTTVM